jgi:hypothetical protein
MFWVAPIQMRAEPGDKLASTGELPPDIPADLAGLAEKIVSGSSFDRTNALVLCQLWILG